MCDVTSVVSDSSTSLSGSGACQGSSSSWDSLQNIRGLCTFLLQEIFLSRDQTAGSSMSSQALSKVFSTTDPSKFLKFHNAYTDTQNILLVSPGTYTQRLHTLILSHRHHSLLSTPAAHVEMGVWREAGTLLQRRLSLCGYRWCLHPLVPSHSSKLDSH